MQIALELLFDATQSQLENIIINGHVDMGCEICIETCLNQFTILYETCRNSSGISLKSTKKLFAPATKFLSDPHVL